LRWDLSNYGRWESRESTGSMPEHNADSRAGKPGFLFGVAGDGLRRCAIGGWPRGLPFWLLCAPGDLAPGLARAGKANALSAYYGIEWWQGQRKSAISVTWKKEVLKALAFHPDRSLQTLSGRATFKTRVEAVYAFLVIVTCKTARHVALKLYRPYIL